MLLTTLAMLALAAAFAYLLWSIGAQYPERSPRAGDRPDEEERKIRRGSDLGPAAPPGRRRRAWIRRSPRRPDPGDPGIPKRVSVDRGLAQMLIDEARAVGGDRRQVARAVRDLARGDDLAAVGRHDQAVERYGRAWARAHAALDDTR